MTKKQLKSIYEAELKSGMFWEYNPELSGNWEKDYKKYKKIIKKRLS